MTAGAPYLRALVLAAALAPARAAAPVPVTNFSLMLPARDGTALHTRVFLPATLAPGQRVGTVLIRTPYGIDTAGSAGDLAAGYAGYGWAAVAQDERGRFASDGEYSFWRSSANDTYDLLSFIEAQSWSNGLVAQTGTSANAIHGYVAPLAQPAPPTQLAAQFNCVGESILHQTTFQGGAYRQGLITGWLDLIGEAAFADEVVAHEAYGPWWGSTTQSAVDGSAGAFALTNFPILHTAGWFDIFSTSQIQTFDGLQAFGGPLARGSQILVVEAGGHCAGGAVAWPNASWGWDVASDFSIELFEAAIGTPAAAAATARDGRERAPGAARAALLRALRDDQRRLKGLAPLGSDGVEAAGGHGGVLQRLRGRVGGRGTPVAGLLKDALIIWYILGPGTPGSLGNIWASAPAWPATNATRLFMHADASLQPLPPAQDGGFAAWTSDPSAPIPTLGGNNLIISPCGPQDQRPLESQFAGSMALFRSAPLAESLVVNGLIYAELWVSSTAVDIDVTVKLTDVYPTGESMLVQDGITRMRWRGGSASTVPLPPMTGGLGAFYNVTVEVGFMSYVFNAGHRVQVAVASSNAQRFGVNPQDLSPLLANATGRGVVASNRLGVGATMPSAIVLPVLPPQTLAEVAL